MNYWIVIPAGYREYFKDESGKTTEEEINPLYRRVLSNSNIIPSNVNKKDPALDTARYTQQLAIQAIDEYIDSLMFGKHKFLNKRYSRRRVSFSTRNVLTSVIYPPTGLDSPDTIGPNNVITGMLQTLKGIINITIFEVRNGFLTKVFPGENSKMVLVDKKTLKKTMLDYNHDLYDLLMSPKGIEKLVDKFAVDKIKEKVIEYKNCYLGLVYDNPKDDRLIVVQDIDELPTSMSAEYLRPLNVSDIFYLAIHDRAFKVPCQVSRYPVQGEGGTYPAINYLKPTNRTRVKYVVNELGNKTGEVLRTWPDYASGFFGSTSVTNAHLATLGADFDGDTVSCVYYESQDALEEIKGILNSTYFYLRVDGGFLYTASNDVSDLMMSTMTSGKIT